MTKHTPVSQFVLDTAASDTSAALAFFLVEQGKPVYGMWTGKLSSADQRTLFGSFIGKGRIVIDGGNEKIHHLVTIAFGQDAEYDFTRKWEHIRNHPRRSNGKIINYSTATA